MKMKSAKLMTLMTAVALGIFSGGMFMAAGNGDFYMQPRHIRMAEGEYGRGLCKLHKWH